VEDKVNDPDAAYLHLSRMMRQGRSWSGRERNGFFLNTRGGRFANIAATSGFDYPDDARAVAITDWDQDGDEDFWVSNRNAPRLRFLRNEAARGTRFLQLDLAGNGTTSNRDAIGARVEVHVAGAEPRVRLKTLRAGEGFLAQSSKRLHFGLDGAAAVEKVVVRWPGGAAEEFRGLELDRRHRLEQGSGRAVPAGGQPGRDRSRGDLALSPSEPELPLSLAQARVPLAALYALPELAYTGFDGSPRKLRAGGGKPVLLTLWASWCPPCLKELGEFAAEKEAFAAAGIQVLALSVDLAGSGTDAGRSKPAEAPWLFERLFGLPAATAPGGTFAGGRAAADVLQVLQLLHDSHLSLHRPLPVPTSFLVDAEGRVAAIYKGPVAPAAVIRDLGHSALSPGERRLRAAPLGGRVIADPRMARAVTRLEVQNRFLFAADLAGMGRLDDAAVQYRDVLALMPDFAEAHSNLGLARFRGGDLEGAEACYRRALEHRPDLAGTHFNLGALHDRRGDLARAAAAYRETLRLDPGYREVRNALGLIRAKEGKLAEALQFFAEEVARNPGFAEAHNNLGLAQLNLGQDAAAEARLREAVRLAPAHADARNNLGVALKRLGRLDEAASQYLEAIRLAPRFAQAHNNLGAILMSQEKLEEAEAHFRQALEAQPDFTAARNNLERVRAGRKAAGK
jgi:Flp pilus assembly protein TadD/thiol-disulfide isomerase/thioredoxin